MSFEDGPVGSLKFYKFVDPDGVEVGLAYNLFHHREDDFKKGLKMEVMKDEKGNFIRLTFPSGRVVKLMDYAHQRAWLSKMAHVEKVEKKPDVGKS